MKLPEKFKNQINSIYNIDQMFQKNRNFAIVDEVDSILIDEARTPLIISGAQQNVSKLYQHINKLIPKILKDDIDEIGRAHV